MYFKTFAISRPGQRGVLGWLCFAAGTDNFLLQFIYDDLALQVPELGVGAHGGTEPAVVEAEAQGIDDVPTIWHIMVLAFIEVPQHGLATVAFRSTEGSIWRDSHSVQVAGGADMVGLQFAVFQVPYLDQLVPGTGDDDGIAAIG